MNLNLNTIQREFINQKEEERSKKTYIAFQIKEQGFLETTMYKYPWTSKNWLHLHRNKNYKEK